MMTSFRAATSFVLALLVAATACNSDSPPRSDSAPPVTSAPVTTPRATVAGTVDVADFGAIADDDTDDANAIAAAIRSGHKTVHLGPGRHLLRAASIRPLSGQRLECAPGAVLVPAPFVSTEDQGIHDSVNRGAIEVVHAADVTIDNCSIDGQSDRHPRGLLFGIHIVGEGSDRVTVRGGTIKNIPGDGDGRTMGDGIYVGQFDAVKGTPEDVLIDGVTVDAPGRQGIAVVQARRVSIRNSTFLNGNAAGVDVEPNHFANVAEHVTISDSLFENNVLGVNVGDFARHVSIIHNTLTAVGEDPKADNISTLGEQTIIRDNAIRRGHHCVYVAGAQGQNGAGVGGAARSVVAGNDISGCTFGVRSTARDVRILDNRVANCSESGVILDGQLDGAPANLVEGNVLTDNSNSSAAFPAQIRSADAKEGAILRNRLVETRGSGGARHGILLHGLPHERATHRIEANEISGASGAPVILTP